MCCGQRRAAARNSPAPSSQQIHSQNVIDSATPGGSPQDGAASADRSRQRVSPAMQGSRGSVLIRYIEDIAIRVQGPETGRRYEFSGDRPVQPVDARDAVALLNNVVHFRRA